jgi:hypothetical protein
MCVKECNQCGKDFTKEITILKYWLLFKPKFGILNQVCHSSLHSVFKIQSLTITLFILFKSGIECTLIMVSTIFSSLKTSVFDVLYSKQILYIVVKSQCIL